MLITTYQGLLLVVVIWNHKTVCKQVIIIKYVIFWVVDIYNMNVVGEKCVWLQNKERIGTHNNTVMML